MTNLDSTPKTSPQSTSIKEIIGLGIFGLIGFAIAVILALGAWVAPASYSNWVPLRAEVSEQPVLQDQYGNSQCVLFYNYEIDGNTYQRWENRGKPKGGECGNEQYLDVIVNPNDYSQARPAPSYVTAIVFYIWIATCLIFGWFIWWARKRDRVKKAEAQAKLESTESFRKISKRCRKHARFNRVSSLLVWPLIATIPAVFLITGGRGSSKPPIELPNNLDLVAIAVVVITWITFFTTGRFTDPEACQNCQYDDVPNPDFRPIEAE